MTDKLLPSKRSTFAAFRWSILGESVSRLIAPAVFLILARILTPEDFGVVAAATVVISLCQAVADLGLGTALIQSKSPVDENAHAAFWISLASSMILGLALFTGAPFISIFFGDDRLTAVTRVLAALVPLSGLAAVPTAILKREFGFKELFWVRLTATGLPALASIPLALYGWGYWALVAGTLTGQIFQCLMLWFRIPWRPNLRIYPQSASKLLAFGRWSALTAVLTWSYAWLDSLIVARYLGLHEMGLYRIGTTFVTLVFGLAFAPMLPVLYSFFSQGKNSPEAFGTALLTIARATMLMSVPIATLIVMLSSSIESYAFGKNWAGLAPILALLAAGQGMAWLVGTNGEIYRAAGRPDVEFITIGISLVIYACGYLASIQYGLLVFVAVRASMVAIGIFIHILASSYLFSVGWRRWLTPLMKPILFSTVSCIFSILVARPFPGIFADAVTVGAFSISYFGLAFIFDRQNLNRILRILYET